MNVLQSFDHCLIQAEFCLLKNQIDDIIHRFREDVTSYSFDDLHILPDGPIDAWILKTHQVFLANVAAKFLNVWYVMDSELLLDGLVQYPCYLYILGVNSAPQDLTAHAFLDTINFEEQIHCFHYVHILKKNLDLALHDYLDKIVNHFGDQHLVDPYQDSKNVIALHIRDHIDSYFQLSHLHEMLSKSIIDPSADLYLLCYLYHLFLL